MDPVTGALISGGSSILGGLINGGWGAANANSAANQNQQNAWLNAQWNLASQQQNQAWMERMSNTAYQRSTADMKAAGLNPALMFGSGGPSSTPSSSPAQMNQPTSRPLAPSGDPITPAVSSALQAFTAVETMKKVAAETENVKATNRLISAQTADTLSHVDVNRVAPIVARAQADNLTSSAWSTRQRGETSALENLNLAKYGTREIGPRTFVGGAIADLFKTYQMLQGQISPPVPAFSTPAPTAKELNPEYRNGRMGRLIPSVN